MTSLLLASSSAAILVSGLVLYVAPKGRIAHWTDWSVCALGKEEWAAVHINIGVLVAISAAVHVWLNWTSLWNYIKRKTTSGLRRRFELPATLGIVCVVVGGTLIEVPPFSSVIAFNDRVKAYWAENAPAAPVPHAEEMSLGEFADCLSLSTREVVTALAKEGFPVEDASTSLAAFARQQEMAPNEIYEAIKRHYPVLGALPHRGYGRRLGDDQGRGPGRGSRRDGEDG
jgi:hypothetical protein